MRQTTGYRSYRGRRVDTSFHAPLSASSFSHGRRGFTLVELVVAAAILLILLIGLAGVFARGVDGFKRAQLLTMAQNLAEFQVEDLMNLAPSVLNQLVLGKDDDPPVGYQDVNYPYPTRNTSSPDYDAVARGHDVLTFMYDSGKLQTDFVVDGVTALGGAFTAGGVTIPDIPTSSDLLLGSNIDVEIYGVDPSPSLDRTYWRPGTVWQYWDGSRWVVLPGLPPGGTVYYYRIVLQHEAYPQFARQVRIAQYDASFPAGSDPWDTTITSYRDSTMDSRREFEYEVTIWYKQNGVYQVLYRTAGTIGSPLALARGTRCVS